MKATISRNKNGHYEIFADGGEGLFADGVTEKEAKEVFEENRLDSIDFVTERDGKRPEWADEEVEFVYSIAAFLQKFSYINTSKFAEECGITPSLMRRYKYGEAIPNKVNHKKISDGLERIKADLACIVL